MFLNPAARGAQFAQYYNARTKGPFYFTNPAGTLTLDFTDVEKYEDDLSALPNKIIFRDPAKVRAYQENQILYIPIASQADFKLSRQKSESDLNYLDSSKYSVDLHSHRQNLAFGFLYHLVKPDQDFSRLDLLLDFHDTELLNYTLGFNWVQAGERTKSRIQSASLLAETHLGPGFWSGSAKYTWSQPNFLDNEYNLTDSSQSLRLGLSIQGLPRISRIGYAYREGRLRTSGLRIPPGSEGTKRFHYALTSTRSHEVNLESPSLKLFKNSESSMDLAGTIFDFDSAPMKDALDQHKETFSYNRLGLSYLADIYGGYSRNAELIKYKGSIKQLNLNPRFKLNYSSLTLDLSSPIALSWLDLSLSGQSVDQGIFKTDITKVYDFGLEGRMLSITPRLTGEWVVTQAMLPQWARYSVSRNQLKLGTKVSQALVVWNDFRAEAYFTLDL